MRARLWRLMLGLFTASVCASVVAGAQGQVVPTRQGHSSTTLADGRVLIAGGDAEGTAEISDPSTGITTALPSRMVVARASHSAVRLANGNVLIVGGYPSGTTSAEQSVEIFEVSTERFLKIGGARTPRILPALALRSDGVVRISGGDAAGSTEFYDPVANTFGNDPAAASIATDRADYAPGETVTFTGVLWAPGEVVTIVLHEQPEIHQDLTLMSVADENGAITNADFAPEEHHIGVTFHVTASGATSNQTATTTFTDAAPPSSTYSLSSGSGTILGGGTDIGNHCDDCTTFITPPFPITFYNNVFNSLIVSSNGNIQFGGAAFENPNFCLPSGIFPGGAIMPYWDDLRTDLPTGSGKGIFVQTTGTAPNRQYHIRWETSYWQSASPTWFGSTRFAVVFYESQARFDYLYGLITGNSATVGVQRTSSGPSTSFGCNISSVANGTLLAFTGVPITTATTTTLNASPSPSGLGQNVNFVATVLWSGNAVTTGTVTLNDGPTAVATGSLNQNGQATFPVSTLTVGSHTMSASYGGSGGLQPSTVARTHVVNKGNTTTSVVLGNNPSVVGQSVTLTANVNPVAPATGTATGTVQFKDAGVDIGSPVALSSGSAVLTTTFTTTPTHPITAVYSGDVNFNTSTSIVTVQTVNKATTTTAVTSDVNPSAFGQAVTFTATVSPVAPGAGTPSGTVQFKDNGINLGSPVTLIDGCASFPAASLTTGTHAITAVYSGDAGFNASTSGALSQVVDKASAVITLNATDLSQTYNGSPRTVGYTTTPAGLTGVSITYAGSPTAPTNAGSYAVVATLTNANYEALTASGTLVINKAAATITLADLAHTFDGSAKSASATTNPLGLAVVSLTYNGSATAPTNADSYAVVATLTNANYDAPNATGTLVISKAAATLTLGDLTHTYNGTAKQASATTSPAGLSGVSITYEGSPAAPTNAGSYAVVATLTNTNYEAPNATGTLVISKATTTMTLTDLAQTYNGSSRQATATTSPAGLSGVSITYDGSPTAPTNAGSYAVVATLTNANYDAPNATGTLVISKATAAIALAGLTHTFDGSPKSATASTSPSGLSGLSITYNGSPTPPTNAGSYAVVATLTNANYEGANAIDTLTIAKANQAIAVTTLVPASAIYMTTFNTAATGGGSGNAVAITTAGACAVTAGGAGSATIQMTSGTGTCTVYYNQAGDTNHNSAPQVVGATTAQKATQTIVVTAGAPPAATFGTSFTVAATGGGSGNTVTITTPPNDGCSDTGPTFTVTSGVAACQVLYNQAGNANYNPATQVVQTVSTIGYAFEGFFSPIDMSTPTATVWNKATAGQAIPTKWRLTLAGVPVASGASFIGLFSYDVSCTTGAGDLEDAIEEYAPGASGLTYDGDGQFHFNWKTPTTYKNKCRAMYVSFSDGSVSPIASFRFK